MDQVLPCTICGLLAEHILLLQCPHNVCLSCATKNYQQSYETEYRCTKCHQNTPLEMETVRQLIKMGQKHRKIVRLPTNSSTTSTAQQNSEVFCFDCKKLLNLSEMLNDVHKNHEIKMAQKSYTRVRVTMQQNMEHLDEYMFKLNNQQQVIASAKKECQLEIQSRKKQILAVYSRLIEVIEKQHEKAISQLFHRYQPHLTKLHEYAESNRVKIEDVQQTKKHLKNLIDKAVQGNIQALSDFSKINKIVELAIEPLRHVNYAIPYACQVKINRRGGERLEKRIEKFGIFSDEYCESVENYSDFKDNSVHKRQCSILATLKATYCKTPCHANQSQQTKRTPSIFGELKSDRKKKDSKQPLQITKLMNKSGKKGESIKIRL